MFSQEYGVSQYERYPTTMLRASRLSGVSVLLNRARAYQNGAVQDWLDALGHPYIDDTTTELYRT